MQEQGLVSTPRGCQGLVICLQHVFLCVPVCVCISLRASVCLYRVCTILEYDWATILDFGGINTVDGQRALRRAAKGGEGVTRTYTHTHAKRHLDTHAEVQIAWRK